MSNNKDLIKSLKQLKNLEAAGSPSRNFVNRNREILMMQIKNSSMQKERIFGVKHIWRIAEAVLPENLFKFVVKPVSLGILIFGAVFGGWAATVSASYGSLPGDKLYSLKIMTEKAQLTLSTREARPSLQVEFAGRRLEEVAKVTSKTSSDNKNKGNRARQAVKNFSRQLKTVKATLENLQSKQDTAKALEIAQAVDRKTTEYISVLEKVKDDVSAEVKQDVEAASSIVSDTGIKAVEVIVKTIKDGASQAEKQEVATKVEEKIKLVEIQVQQLSSTSTISGEITQEAKSALIEAKQALDNKDLTIVVDKLAEVKNLVNNAAGNTDDINTPQ
jgi:hypothetical protein